MIISNQSFSYEDRIIAIINDNVILQSELTEKLDFYESRKYE